MNFSHNLMKIQIQILQMETLLNKNKNKKHNKKITLIIINKKLNKIHKINNKIKRSKNKTFNKKIKLKLKNLILMLIFVLTILEAMGIRILLNSVRII